MLEYENGQPKFLLGALADKVEGLYGAEVLHFAGNTYPVFDQLVQLAAADANAMVTGKNQERVAELRKSYRPSFNHKGPFWRYGVIPTMLISRRSMSTSTSLKIVSVFPCRTSPPLGSMIQHPPRCDRVSVIAASRNRGR